ncbi:MFS transporter [Pseudomonas sp.]|uniref:MFS transporter n=1 Tax=Pseudomonas sp. TaxID=306 RepID=UPI00263400AE|nr:MFS transporter [Pseudomonas sp.]
MNAIHVINSKSTLLAICLMMVVSLGTLQIQPVLGGALVDQLGIPLPAIGSIFATELMAMAMASGISALLVTRLDRRLFVRVALIILVLANLLSTQMHDWSGLLLVRMVAGASGGAVMAVVLANATLRSNKDATFAMINIANLLWGTLTVTSLPLILANFGVKGAFLAMALAVAFSLLGTGRVPRRLDVALQETTDNKHAFGATAMLLLLLFALLFMGHSALWVYQERIGKSIGLLPEQIGAILGGSILAGAVGAGLAGLLGKRLGVLIPQLIGFGGALVATLLMVNGTSPAAFAITACLIHMVWFFSLPYLLSMAAELDPSGRLPGLGNAAIFIGQGIGPFCASLLVGDGHFRAVGWFAAAVYCLGIVISCVVAAHFRQRRSLINAEPSLV